MAHETVIKGGRVIDPASGIDAVLDIALAGGKVVEVASNIDANSAEVIDAAGQIVTPGLIDLHTHIYWGVTYWGIEPDPVAAKTGVTTWLDVGSAGSYTFPGFRRYVAEPSAVRVFSLLNLSVIGLVAPTWELSNLDYCNVDIGAMMVDANRDLILGIKARIDRNTTRGTGIRPLELARELADRVDLPLMVHIGAGPPTIDEVADLLRPGDILTHCFTGGDMRILNDDGLINPTIKELQERGLVLDIGHGTGSFSFETTDAMLAQGVLPDVISSDIHQMARQGPMFDMPTTLSKFLNLGLSLSDVIDRATARPAAAMRRPELGSLAAGSLADVAIWRLEEGDFTYYDVHLNARTGPFRLVNTLTMVEGKALAQQPERPMLPWTKLPEHQQPIIGMQPGDPVS